VVAILNSKWRVIQCHDCVQWVLQSRDSTSLWRGHSYCRSREALLRCVQKHAGAIEPTAVATLAALPARIEHTFEDAASETA
jgi:hypothetical protein